jgi:hypothetical protein
MAEERLRSLTAVLIFHSNGSKCRKDNVGPGSYRTTYSSCTVVSGPGECSRLGMSVEIPCQWYDRLDGVPRVTYCLSWLSQTVITVLKIRISLRLGGNA